MDSFLETLLKNSEKFMDENDELIQTFSSPENVLNRIPIRNPTNIEYKIDLDRNLITDGFNHYTIVNDLKISRDSNEKHRVLVLPQFEYGNAKKFIESTDLFKEFNCDKITTNLFSSHIALTQVGNRYFITKLVLDDNFKSYYKYSFINMLGGDKNRDKLLNLLKCEFAVVAQPYFMFEIKYEIEETPDRHYYVINDKNTFDFLYENNRNETLMIIKEFVRLDKNYLVDSAIKGKFISICVTNHDKTKKICNV